MPSCFWLIRITNIQNIIGSIAIAHLKRVHLIEVEDADAK